MRVFMFMLLIVMLRLVLLVILFLRVRVIFMIMQGTHRVRMAQEQFGSPLEELARFTMSGAVQSAIRPPKKIVIHAINLRTSAVPIASPGPGYSRSVESPARGGVGKFVIRRRSPSAQKSALGLKFRLLSIPTAATMIVVVFMVVQMRDAAEGNCQPVLPTRRQRAQHWQ